LKITESSPGTSLPRIDPLFSTSFISFKEANKPVLDKWIDEVGVDLVASAKLDRVNSNK